MNSKFLYALDQIRTHFDDAWNIKGDGKWRVIEIAKYLKTMSDAAEEALDADEAALADTPSTEAVRAERTIEDRDDPDIHGY